MTATQCQIVTTVTDGHVAVLFVQLEDATALHGALTQSQEVASALSSLSATRMATTRNIDEMLADVSAGLCVSACLLFVSTVLFGVIC